MEKRFADLVRQAEASDVRSPYLDRLRSRMNPEGFHKSVEQELFEEMANSLGRAGDKIDAALLELDLIAKELSRCAPGSREALVERFNAQREVCLQARHDLLVQRECIGLRDNATLDYLYPVPEPLVTTGAQRG